MAKTLRNFIRDNNLTISAQAAESNPFMDDPSMSHWKVTITGRFYNGSRRRLTTPFSMGSAHTGEPEIESVLDCLLSDASSADQSFEDWAADLGFDTDSRKAEKTYRAVQASAASLRSFLGETYQEALHCERE
ncbi:MAG: hypothetical protein LC723_12215 [Actinobacteria bacterium]|nr:hypothetical protein [Actinomycetota bacterium]